MVYKIRKVPQTYSLLFKDFFESSPCHSILILNPWIVYVVQNIKRCHRRNKDGLFSAFPFCITQLPFPLWLAEPKKKMAASPPLPFLYRKCFCREETAMFKSRHLLWGEIRGVERAYFLFPVPVLCHMKGMKTHTALECCQNMVQLRK